MAETTLTRRAFVTVTGMVAGGLAVGFDLARGAPAPSAPGMGVDAVPPEAFAPNAWIRVLPDDRIVFVLDKTEMGQGVMTALPMIVAEELGVDPDRLEVVNAPADRRYVGSLNLQLTGGSASVASSWKPLREAGSVTRQMLVTAGARSFGVPESECTVDGGRVKHAPSGREATFGSLATAAAKLPVPAPKPKDPKDFKVVGRSVRRLDALAKVTGKAGFGIDVQLPGLVVAVVKRCPVFGGKAKSYDAAKVAAVPGIEGVIDVPSGVAIVAKRYWQARKAAELLEIEWDLGPRAGASTEATIAEYDKRAAATLKDLVGGSKIAAALKSAGDKVVDAVYELPYLAHAPMEPINCTAQVTASGCDIWAPTQAPGLAQQLAAEVTGLPHDKVRVHTTFIGGGFGRRLYQDFVVEAVEIARRIKKPVKVQWSREDDIRHDFYRPATVHHLKGAVNAGGGVAAWTHAIVGQSLLIGALPEWLRAMMPIWMPEGLKAFAGRTAGSVLRFVGDDQTSHEGADDIPYAVDNLAVEYGFVEEGPPVGFWRSVGHSYTGFVVESFVDELAHAAGTDPVEFRRKLLKDHARHLGVLDLAVAKAGWSTPPPAGVFRGVAQHFSFGSYAAHVAEVSVKDGAISVQRIVSAIDCGRAVNPDLVAAQVESAVVFGLSAALMGEITVKDGAIVQSNFHDYPVMRMAEAPRIEVHVVPSEADPSGVGEPGLPPIAPAIANAVFAATGKRLRKLPLKLG
jgi:CO/xanthine dehydrogenase Mo-binding subunit